jgi:hypothetical protein
MHALRRWWEQLRRRPRSAPLVAELQELAIVDPSADIAHLLEGVLSRALRRQVFMVKIAPDWCRPLSGMGGQVGNWVTKARRIDAWFRDADLQQLPNGLHCPRRQIQALVPIMTPSDTVIAMVAIGRKRLRRLSGGECSMVEAAIGMAVLLIQQAQLRQQVNAAKDLGSVAERMAEAQRLQRGISAYLNENRN